ncbi:MAG: 6-carboxytetrahydropterin synthase QueD [Acidobacteriota bacterium]|nr:6-carboxytetrahydropterin synthase QueD [Acidobacteriota bacterium]MDQ7088255.1 6-carboxytetrahydropterin synthase QueD [Acidobacteriota bacterium]
MIVRRSYTFEASHQLPRHPGKCRRLHGHSYRFIVEVEGEIDPVQGMVIDFFDLDEIVDRRILQRLDHRHINDLIENPTAEWIAVWIYRQLREEVPGLRSVELFEVESASALYRGELESAS